MKRILSLLLVLVLLCGLLTTVAFAETATSGTCGDNLTWVLDSDGTLTISGTGNMYAEPYWNGYNDQIKSVVVEEGVTSIGSCAFYECYGLEKVSLPETLMSIGTNAFYCTGITEVAIPDDVAEIWEQAFDVCRQLKKITLGENLEYIGIGAFRSTAITEITIPAGVAVIDYKAFGDCANLTEVTFLGDAPAMDHVFSGVTATVYYPAGNPTWTADVMQNYGGTLTWESYGSGESESPGGEVPISGTCGENLTWVLDSDGTLTISGTGNMYAEPYWNGYNDQIKSVVVEEGVTSIGSCAFYECYGLEKVSLPETLMSIGTNAFYCTGITEVAIPDDVAEIWEQAFDVCRQLKKITLGENLEYIGIGAFRSTAITEITIPAGVAVIDYKAFGDCANLTKVTFLGDAPAMDHVFSGVTATVYYPEGNPTWTADVMQNYGGELTWIPYGAAIPGDMDGDGVLDDKDVAQLLWHTLFPESFAISGNADFTGDGVVDDADVAYLLWHTLFPEAYPIG